MPPLSHPHLGRIRRVLCPAIVPKAAFCNRPGRLKVREVHRRCRCSASNQLLNAYRLSKIVFSAGLRGYFTSLSAQTEEAQDCQSGYVMIKDRVLLYEPALLYEQWRRSCGRASDVGRD
jgi:hypothetical protein